MTVIYTVIKRRRTVSSSVVCRVYRGCRGKSLNSRKICHGSYGEDDILYKSLIGTNATKRELNVTDREARVAPEYNMESLPLWCEVCCQTFSGPIPAQQHFQSSKHRKKEENVARFGRSGLFCQVCNIHCDTQEMLRNHESSPRHLAMAQKQQQLSMSLTPASSETSLHEHDQSPARSTGSPNQDREYVFNGSRGFCYLCDLDLTSEAHATSHLNGKNHMKKKRQRGLYGNDESRCVAGSQADVEMKEDEFCTVCRVTFTGPDCARQHYISEKHRKKVVLLRYDHGYDISEDLTRKSAGQKHLDTSNLVHHERINESKDKPESVGTHGLKCDLCQVFLSGPENAQQHYASEKHKKKLLSSDSGANQSTLSCNICNVRFSCGDNKRDHMASAKHKKAVELKEKEESGNLLPLFCDVCDCKFTGQESAEAHFKSKKHKRNEENKVIQNNGSTNQASIKSYIPHDFSNGISHMDSEINREWHVARSGNLDMSHETHTERKSHDGCHTDDAEGKKSLGAREEKDEYLNEDINFLAQPTGISDFERNGTTCDFENAGRSLRMLNPIGNGRPRNDSPSEVFSSSSIETPLSTSPIQQERSDTNVSNYLNESENSYDENKIKVELQTSQRPKLSELLAASMPQEGDSIQTVSDSGTLYDDQPVRFIRNDLQSSAGIGRGLNKMCNLFNNPQPGQVCSTTTSLEKVSATQGSTDKPCKQGQIIYINEGSNEDDETKLRIFKSKIDRQDMSTTIEDTKKQEEEMPTHRAGPFGQYQVLQFASKGKMLEEDTDTEVKTNDRVEVTERAGSLNKGVQGRESIYSNYMMKGGGDYHTLNNSNCNLENQKVVPQNSIHSPVNRHRRLSSDSNISGTHSEGSLKGTNSEGSYKGSFNQDEYRFSDTDERGWCNVCNIELTSKNHMRQHVYGRKHSKAREVWAKGVLEDPIVGPYKCNSCNMVFTGPEPQQQHFDSEKHKNRAKQYGKEGQEYFCDICKVPCSGEVSYRQHLAGAQHRKMSGEVNNSSISTGIDQTQWYSCDICKCQLNTRQQLDIHKQSPRHLAKAQKLQSYGTDIPGEIQHGERSLLVGANLAAHELRLDQSDQLSLLDKFLSEPLFPDEYEADKSEDCQNGKTVKEPKPFIKPEITDEPVPVMKRFGTVDTRTGTHAANIDHETPVNETGSTKKGQGSDLAWATRSKSIGSNVKKEIGERSTGMRSNVSTDTRDMSREKSTPKSSSVQHATLGNENPYAATHKYYCQTCKAPMNTKESYEAHIRGKRHITKVCNEMAPDRLHMPRVPLDLNEIPKTEMVPRGYQVELFRKSMIWDTLCFLPTGTGKTLVSVLTMCRMLQESPSKNVLFLVDKVLLVLQQSKFIKKQIGENEFVRYDPDSDDYQRRVKRNLNIAAVCMGQQSTNGLPLWKHDVVIVTAAFCKNLLDQGILKWSDFSLVIFDEAHHCEKGHPFNTLLLQYHSQIQVREQIPKVLGLTASPAGKSDLPKTIVMLENLLANMGHSQMNVVEEPENVATLKAIQSNAEIIVKVQGKGNDSESSENEQIKRLLALYIVDCLKLLAQFSNIESYVDLDWIRRGKLSYEVFECKIDEVQASLGMITSDDMDKVQFTMFTRHIMCICMAYNSLLEGGVLCAYEEIVEMENMEANFSFAKSIGLPCKSLYDAILMQGQGMSASRETGSDMSHNAGSHIESLLKELLQSSDGNQFQGRKPMSLVLVKERSTAHKLCTVLNGSLEMQRRGLKCVSVVGHGSSGAADKGMSVAQQKQVLEEIKQHMYQVVIATSVAEEGVDWPECDCVISMYPPSTVTALVQMRGRARIKHSKFIILCESEIEREKLQDIMRREANMMEATRTIVQRQNQA